MFKAIGRWGSQVKSRIRIPFLTNLFASKNKEYAGIDDDDEETFIDAKEDPADFSDTEEDTVEAKSTGNGHVANNGEASVVQSTSVSETNSSDPVADDAKETDRCDKSGEQLVDLSVHRPDTDSSHAESSNESEHSDDDGDDQHDSHCDKKKIIAAESKTNGMAKSPSTSTFKKVHRRISSLTQKQYTKLDNNKGDDSDHLIHHESDSPTNENTEATEERRKEKKPSRRKKVQIFEFVRSFFRFPTRQTARTRMN